MAGRLNGKVAVVTGGASGIGRATALLFAREGARVIVGDINEAGAAETQRLAAESAGTEPLRFVRTDVTQEADVAALIAAATQSHGQLDVLFNNAGGGGALNRITEISVDDWDRTFATYLRSVFLGIKHGARAMQAIGIGGSIINTASTAGLVGGSGPTSYSAAKAGVVSLTCNAAIELAADRIRVNAIAPGCTYTPMVAEREEDARAFIAGYQPWPDTGQAIDIAQFALLLASDESRFCTGSTLTIDGGLIARGPGLFPKAELFDL